MKKILLYSFSISILAFSSCAKKCKAPKDSGGGLIISDVIIYPSVKNAPVKLAITASTQYGADALVSFDGGYTRIPVDYSKYNLMCNEISTKCDAGFERSVDVDPVLGIVTYSIDVTECETCPEKYKTMNYVLTKKWDPTLTPIFKVN
jgi:hypothetical protein